MNKSYQYKIVGNQHRPIDAQLLFRQLKNGSQLFLKHDPNNPFDPNAVEVHATVSGESTISIGFIPKGQAEHLAHRLDAGLNCTCTYEDGYVVVNEVDPGHDEPPYAQDEF